MPLAELDIGILKHDWDDPRVQGFAWMMDGDAMDAAQKAPLGPWGQPAHGQHAAGLGGGILMPHLSAAL